MHAGWHLLLDDYLERCSRAFQCNSLDGLNDLESALQEQLQSQVGISTVKCVVPCNYDGDNRFTGVSADARP